MNVLVSFILVAGIVITLLIVMLLLKSKYKALPQYVLTVFFVFLLCVSLNYYASLHQIQWLYTISFIPSDTTAWIVGPLLLVYIKSLFVSEQGFLKKMSVHFIPFLCYCIGVSIPVMGYEIFQISMFSYIDNDYFDILYIIEDLYLMGYLILSLCVLDRYRQLMKVKYSNFTTYDFEWIKVVLIGSIGVIGLDFIFKVIEDLLEILMIWDMQYIVVIAMILLIVYLGYYGVNQSKVLLPDFLILEKHVSVSENIETVVKSKPNLNIEAFEMLKDKLERVLEVNQPYLDEELTLHKLAQQLGTTDKKLSTLLNQYMNTTFYDLINAYRIAAIKEKLHSEAYENYTLLGISYECGFKSKTSFNRIFKKETGLSPSEYKKSLSYIS